MAGPVLRSIRKRRGHRSPAFRKERLQDAGKLGLNPTDFGLRAGFFDVCRGRVGSISLWHLSWGGTRSRVRWLQLRLRLEKRRHEMFSPTQRRAQELVAALKQSS
jgi:hypothetical protein